MSNFSGYIFLFLAIILGIISNGFLKYTNVFTILTPTIVGVYKFNQMPDIFTIVGLTLIISGVLIVNLLGKTN